MVEKSKAGRQAIARSRRNWPQDSAYENGNYNNCCCVCGNDFTGHRRRVLCRKCADTSPAVKRINPEAESLFSGKQLVQYTGGVSQNTIMPRRLVHTISSEDGEFTDCHLKLTQMWYVLGDYDGKTAVTCSTCVKKLKKLEAERNRMDEWADYRSIPEYQTAQSLDQAEELLLAAVSYLQHVAQQIDSADAEPVGPPGPRGELGVPGPAGDGTLQPSPQEFLLSHVKEIDKRIRQHAESIIDAIAVIVENTKQRCPNCDGQGYYFYETVGDMLTCGRRDDIDVTMRYMVTCPSPKCKGTGFICQSDAGLTLIDTYERISNVKNGE